MAQLIVPASPPGASADDRDVSSGGATYPPSGTLTLNSNRTGVHVRKNLLTAVYDVRVALLQFDTSPLENGDTITAAALRFSPTTVARADSRNLVGEVYGWDGTTADYTLAVGNTAIETALLSITNLAVNDVPLKTASFGSINRSGMTKLRLGIDGGVPNGANQVIFVSNDNTLIPEPFVGAGYPRLVIDYTPGPVVAITTTTSGNYAHLSGVATLAATASDTSGANPGVQRVEFWYGAAGTGVLIGSDTTSPYSVSWDTRKVPNGPVPVTARVYDNDGNFADTVATLVVNNSGWWSVGSGGPIPVTVKASSS